MPHILPLKRDVGYRGVPGVPGYRTPLVTQTHLARDSTLCFVFMQVRGLLANPRGYSPAPESVRDTPPGVPGTPNPVPHDHRSQHPETSTNHAPSKPAGGAITRPITAITHGCATKHRTTRTLAVCQWPRAVWITGSGEWALLAHCDVLKVTLHATEEDAQSSKRFIDRTGCGHACTRRHEIVRLAR